jgi:DNA adenine methylase
MKPIIKWVGGKTQIVDKLLDAFPPVIENYHEIFLGGGSVLLELLDRIKSGKSEIKISGRIYAYDVNEPLIYVYKNIQSNHNGLYRIIRGFIDEFSACSGNDVNRAPISIEDAKLSKENYYYWMRARYNRLSPAEKTTVEGSALFIFLNKTCFRGVFRLGPNGFNVPYGHYANPEIINRAHLDEMHELIRDVVFECADFTVSMEAGKIGDGDFVYLDPPYAPENAKSFVGYTDKGFPLDQHNRLFGMCRGLKKMMMSNADVALVRQNFPVEQYVTNVVSCKRSINSKNPEAKTNEVIIMNY